MTSFSRLALTAAALACSATLATAAAPNGKGAVTVHAVRGDSQAANQISFHGGPVLTNANGVNVYIVWYGDWSNNTATTIIPEFLTHLGGTPHWNINTTYYDASNVHVQNKVNLKGQTTDAYSMGSALSDSAIATIVKNAVLAKKLPADTNGLYFVLTSKDVNETSGFCTQYCGWHNHALYQSKQYKYSFVGDSSRCIASCAAQSNSPNGNPGADGMLSVITHELEETVTDPELNAWWFTATGQENADACAWTFGTEYTTSNGSKANMNINGHDYLIQQNWIQQATGKCAVSF